MVQVPNALVNNETPIDKEISNTKYEKVMLNNDP